MENLRGHVGPGHPAGSGFWRLGQQGRGLAPRLPLCQDLYGFLSSAEKPPRQPS